MHTIKITPKLTIWISVYIRQIYLIAESNQIEKNRFGSENRIETFLPELECSSTEVSHSRLAVVALAECLMSFTYLFFFMMSINNVGGCCFIFHRLVNKDYDWDSLVQFVMHYSFIIMQELLLPIRQQPPIFMNIRNYVRNAVSDITRNWLNKMEISNVFPLISNFVFELSLFVVVDGAVKFLQNTRLL